MLDVILRQSRRISVKSMRIWIPALVVMIFPQSYANESLREKCRKGLSGIYLVEFDAADQLRMNLIYLDKKIPEIEKKVVKLKKDLAAALQKEKDAGFNIQFETERKRVQSLLESSTHHLTQLLEQKQKNTEEHSIRKARFEKYHEQVGTLFVLKHSTRKKGYPDRLDFKEQCPPFREACTLLAKDAHALLNLLELVPMGDVRTECERYASQSGVILE
jgi:hypothetical protein